MLVLTLEGLNITEFANATVALLRCTLPTSMWFRST